MKSSRRVLFLLLALGMPLALHAHPHIWITSRAEVVIAAGFVEKVNVQWTFDELFTSMLLMDNDANGDGKLDATESAALKKGYFDHLSEYGYFVHLTLGRAELPVKTVTNFVASVNAEGRAVYRFSVVVGQRLDAKTSLSLGFYDTSFYTDIVFEKQQPLSLTVTDGGKAGFLIKPNPAKTFYGGQVVPTEAVISWRP